MTKKPYYNWFASDFLGSPFVLSLEPLEEFCYRRLLDMQATSEDGRISGDIKKMKAQCKNLPSFGRAWEVLKVKFPPHPDGRGGFANLRLLEILDERNEYLDGRSRAGKLGAEARWKDRQSDGLANGTANGLANGKPDGKPMASTSTSTSKGDSNTEKSPLIPVLPPAEKRGGRADEAADLFSGCYLVNVGSPYGSSPADFVQLAALRRRLKIGTTKTPELWAVALQNYFASPLAKFSLKHLSADFDTFRNSPLDRYGKPINHKNAGVNGNGSGKTKDEINRENAQRVLSRLHPEAGGGGECDADGSDADGLLRATVDA